ncbi:MAG: pyridoxal phosphate-dependent aminotransferase family protein [Bacteroidota bacterium]
MNPFPKRLQEKLAERGKNNLLRGLLETENRIDFSSNDYLGFAKNETLYAKTFQLLLKEGIAQNGATGSRLISGNHVLYTELEEYLANFHNSDSALVFNSGYDANIGFFSSVPQRNDFVFYDELIHASIRDGITMGHAKRYKFRHNDLEHLKEVIKRVVEATGTSLDLDPPKTNGCHVYVVTESVFSMDGDTPDLKSLSDYCVQNGYYLVVDEAHAVGVFGKRGIGLVQDLGLQKNIFARIITFGKALGCHGAAILGSTTLKSYLLNFARSFIYTTGLPPHNVASILSSYAFLETLEGKAQLKALDANIDHFNRKIRILGLVSFFIPSVSAIQSCLIPGNDKVKFISKKLSENGFNVKAILSPTVAEGEERLRFCLHSDNTKEEIGFVLQLLRNSM